LVALTIQVAQLALQARHTLFGPAYVPAGQADTHVLPLRNGRAEAGVHPVQLVAPDVTQVAQGAVHATQLTPFE
jgi:hypothetical protein